MSNSVASATDERCSPLVRDPLSIEEAGAVAAVFKALSDPVRLRLFSLIAGHADGQACVCDIAPFVDVSQPTVSHHLRVLKDAGLLVSERRASWVHYRVVPEALTALTGIVAPATDDATCERAS